MEKKRFIKIVEINWYWDDFFRSMFVYLLLCNILSLFLGKLFLIVSLMLIPIALLSYYIVNRKD